MSDTLFHIYAISHILRGDHSRCSKPYTLRHRPQIPDSRPESQILMSGWQLQLEMERKSAEVEGLSGEMRQLTDRLRQTESTDDSAREVCLRTCVREEGRGVVGGVQTDSLFLCTVLALCLCRTC